MAFLYYVVISFHIITCLLLIAIVLLQQGKGQDLASAFGGGGSQTAFGPRGSATVLSRATTVLAALFMITSLSLSMMKSGGPSVLDQIEETPAAATEAAEEAVTPPVEESSEPAPEGETETPPAESE